MAINMALLHYELGQMGLPVEGVSVVIASHATQGIAEFYQGPNDLVRVDYSRVVSGVESAAAQTAINNHNPAALTPWDKDEVDATTAKTTYRNLPNYATWTPDEAQTNITNAILSGKTGPVLDAEIDALPNSFVGIKAGMKVLANGVVDVRTILAIIGKLLTLLRIIAVRRF